MFAIDFAHKRMKQTRSKIESLSKVQHEEDVSLAVSEQESLIKSYTESILKFSEVSIRRSKDACRVCPHFYEKYSNHLPGPISLFSSPSELAIFGIKILNYFVEENQFKNFVNLWIN